MIDIIKHNLPVYYNPIHHGLHVVHEDNDEFLIVSDCCKFYADAYTSIIRIKIKKEFIKQNRWIRLNKRKLFSYVFLTRNNFINSLAVTDQDTTGNQPDRWSFYFDHCENLVNDGGL